MAKRIQVGGRIESKEVGGIVTGAAEILDDAKGKKQSVINGETDDELVRLDQSKQNNLTFDNAPTEGSDNPVKSGGVYAADKALSDAIEAILLLIPSAASALNKLVDTAMMNSSISTATATFKGTYNVVTDLSLTVDATHEQIAAALGNAISTADNNDYAFVQVPVSAESTDIRRTERYKFNGTVWGYEYDLNTSGFTAAQWAAINSGITIALVGKLIGLPTSSELMALLGQKQDTLTFDNIPTSGSANPVKSGGVYSAINKEKTAREQLAQSVTGINGRLGNVEDVIPSGAAANNKLVANNSMEAYVTSIIEAITASFTIATADGHINLSLTQTNGRVASLTLTSSDIASAQALTALASRVTTAEGNITSLGGRMTTAEGNITSLGGRVSTNETDIANLQQLYNDLQQSKPVPVTALPETGQQQGVIYRLAGTTSYSDYMWNGSTWVLMATYNNAIDSRPKKASQNLVTSGGVFDNMGALDVSELNATENPHTLAKYVDLSAALATIPTDYQKGGMSIKFVQSSDNKYVQYFCNSQTFTNNVTAWEKVNLEKEVEEINIDTGKITIVKDYENDGTVAYVPCTIKSGKTYKVVLTMLEAGNFWAVSLTTTTLSSTVDNLTERGDYAANEKKTFTFRATGDANYIAVRNGSGQLLFSYKINIITENSFSKPLNEQIQDLRSDVDTIDNDLDSVSEDVDDINEVLDITGGEEVTEINVTDGTMWHLVALEAGHSYTIKITTNGSEILRLIGATAESLSNVTEEFFREDFVANQEKTIRFTPTLNCAYIAFVRTNSASVYKWSGILYTTLISNIDVLSKEIATDKNDKASIIPKTLVFTYDSNSKSGKLQAQEGYVYCIQYAVETSFYDADNNKLAATALRANCAYLAPVNTCYIEYTGVAGHAGSTFCVGVIPYASYDDNLFNQYWRRVVSINGSISTVNYNSTISNLLAGDSESTAIKNQVDLKAFDFSCYGGQRTSFIASNCNKGNVGSNITWQILKDNNVIVIDGTNNPSNWTVEPAYYVEMVRKLKALGANKIYGMSKFVGKGTSVSDVMANDKTYKAQKAFFGDQFIDILGYMASCGVFLNHYFAEPFIQPAVGSNVTIEVEDVSAFTEVSLFVANENFIIRYTDANDDSADGNKYDEYQCVSIDSANNQITAKLVTNNGVPVGGTAGKYETTRDTGASSGTYTVNGYIYRQIDEEAVGLGYLPHFLFTDNIHVGKIACRVVETMLKIRNII